MGATYTRQSSSTIVDGATIEASHFNAEFDQLVTAFAADTGHTHDGTSAEGGDVTKLLGTAITIGDGTAGTDIAVTFDGETNDGLLTWMEDEDYFKFSDDILVNSTEKLMFQDTGTYIYSNADGDLDLVSDGTAIDSINIESAGGITLDAGSTTHGITYEDDGTPMLQITNSSSDVIIKPLVDSKDIIFQQYDGTEVARIEDNATFNVSSAGKFAYAGTAVTTTAAELNLIDGDTARGTTSVASGDGILINDAGTMRMTDVDTVSTYFASHSVGGSNIVTTGALDSGSITSGFGAIDNGTSGIRTNTFTAETSIVPDASDGATLGSASLEWSDLYLADGGIIYFGDDQDTTLTHVADVGLTLTHVATADNKPIVFQLKSEEDAIVADEVIASIEFAAGDSDGTDGATVAAGIHAIAEGTFAADANATKLVFTTGVSETAASSATAKMTLSSAGLLTIADDFMIKDGGTIGVASANDAMTISSAGIVTFKDDILIKDGGTIGVASANDAMTISSAGIVTFKDDIIIKDAGTIGSASDTDAISISSGGVVNISATTASSNASTGALTVAGGAGIAADLSVGDDLRLISDDAVLSFGGGSDVTIKHDPDDGLIFKSTATADDNPFLLTLQTGETDISTNEVLGAINFQAPDEGTGTDAILVAAGIEAVSEGAFSSSNNATKLSFKTAASEAASEKMLIDSAGNVGISDSSPSDYYGNTKLVISDTTSAEVAALTLRSATDGTGFIAFADSNSGNARFAGYIQYQHATDMMSFGTGSSAEIRLVQGEFYPSANNSTDLGTSSNKYKNLYVAGDTVSGSINFGDATLSNYETGTWSPDLYGLTTAGTRGYSTQTGTYTRIGRMVFIQFHMTMNAWSGAAGQAAIQGLPFAVTSAINVQPTTVGYSANVDIPGAGEGWSLNPAASTSRLDTNYYEDDGGGAALSVGDFASNSEVRFAGAYFTDAS